MVTRKELDKKRKDDLKKSFGNLVLETGKAVLDKKAKEKQEEEGEQEALQGLGTPRELPKPAPAPTPSPEPDPSRDPEVFRDQKTGNITGVTIEGKTFLGLNEEEVRSLVERRTKPIPGTVEVGEATEERKQKSVQESISEEVGKVVFTGDVEKDKLSIEQAIKSGLAGATAGVIGGAAVGAVAGGVPTAGIGAIPGAIAVGAVSGVGGFLAGFRANLKTQRTDMVKGEAQNLMKTEQNMLKLVMETNKFGDYSSTLPMFNAQLSLIDENEQRLNLETTDDLSKWLGEDGHKQLEKYETFNSVGGMRDILILQMQNAISNPDPNANVLLQQYFDAKLGDELAEADL